MCGNNKTHTVDVKEEYDIIKLLLSKIVYPLSPKEFKKELIEKVITILVIIIIMYSKSFNGFNIFKG